MSRQEIINRLNQLSDSQLKQISDYIESTFSGERMELNEEQKRLLDLLNYTIDSGRGDFAEKHDAYLYGVRKPA
jgi:hypothetical protein